jgi:hypothetical protein
MYLIVFIIYVNVFESLKFVKLRCHLGIFVTFGSSFQIKLTIHGSSLSLRCISMSELEFVKEGLCS